MLPSDLALNRSPHRWNQLTLGSFSVLLEEAWQALSLFLGWGNESDLDLLAFNRELVSSAWEEGW